MFRRFFHKINRKKDKKSNIEQELNDFEFKEFGENFLEMDLKLRDSQKIDTTDYDNELRNQIDNVYNEFIKKHLKFIPCFLSKASLATFKIHQKIRLNNFLQFQKNHKKEMELEPLFPIVDLNKCPINHNNYHLPFTEHYDGDISELHFLPHSIIKFEHYNFLYIIPKKYSGNQITNLLYENLYYKHCCTDYDPIRKDFRILNTEIYNHYFNKIHEMNEQYKNEVLAKQVHNQKYIQNIFVIHNSIKFGLYKNGVRKFVYVSYNRERTTYYSDGSQREFTETITKYFK